MDADSVKAIIAEYVKHGWKLRRVLLSRISQDSLFGDLREILAAADFVESVHAGLWFSRRSQADREAWELRRLSGSPYALVTSIDDEMSEIERETTLKETEIRMFETPRTEPMSH